MNLTTTMPHNLRPYYAKELHAYRQKLNQADLQTAWTHLERAHVIAQAYPYEHSFVHWKMLQFGIKIKSTKEVMGQIPRLLIGGVKSFVGKVPVGNTGGSNVPPLRTMSIDTDIQIIFKKAGIS